MAAQKTQNLPPIWERSSVKPVKLLVHLNGEQFLPAKDVTLNRKVTTNFDNWLDSMTLLLRPRGGALRCAFTPQNGHRVRSLESLKDGDRVVLGCRDVFHRFSYESIHAPRKGHHAAGKDAWTGQSSRYQVSAQYRKVDTHGTRILCWQNNNSLHAAVPVVLPPQGSPLLSMELVLNRVNEKMSKASGRLVDRLFTPDGQAITSVDQLQPNCSYVAVCEYDSFKKKDYPEKSLPLFSISPRTEIKVLPPISRSTKTSSQSSPEHSVSSNNGYRRERGKKEGNEAFHYKPVKHKRSSEKVRQTDYDNDNGGVFKAKSQNKATEGAIEVQETQNTKTEVPVDQRPDEEVQEDVSGKDKKGKKG